MRLPRRRAQHELPSYDGGPTAKRRPVFAAVCEAVFGPNAKCRDVRDLIAIGWEADLTRTSNFGRD
jgi:hypothetical protein